MIIFNPLIFKIMSDSAPIQPQIDTTIVNNYERIINSLNVGDCFIVKGNIEYRYKHEKQLLTGTNLLWVISKRTTRHGQDIRVVCLTSVDSHPDNSDHGVNYELEWFTHDFSLYTFEYEYISSHEILGIIPCAASMKNSRVKRAVSKESV